VLEAIVTAIPGPRSLALAARLRHVEPRGVTYLGAEYPVFWESAAGATVTDVDGNRYLDLTSAFGVASSGHANAAVAAAVAAQAAQLPHGMGDVHPTEVRTRLLEELARIAPGDLCQTFLSTSGADAVEFALKTALLATGKPRAIAYRGAYHGLTIGALEVAGIDKFHDPFAALVPQRARLLPFPDAATPLGDALAELEAALAHDSAVGAVVLEPIQGRGGVIVPPDGFLRGVRRLCDTYGALMILDEIYTGFGRVGTMFACEREAVVPDLLCVGKALAGGMPLAATIGSQRVMDAWPASMGEAIHTSTFLGNPTACAAALANLGELETPGLLPAVRERGARIGERLARLRAYASVCDVRGLGFLWAVEFSDGAAANAVVVEALTRGLIVLQSGPTGTSITLAPPFVIDDLQLARALEIFEESVSSLSP
jgi:4-aminobutyrate aminotransferase-like enzyme